MKFGRDCWKWVWIGTGVLVLYLVTAVPVGMALYAIKVDLGWDVFKRSGYHAFSSCVAKQFSVMEEEQRRRLSQ